MCLFWHLFFPSPPSPTRSAINLPSLLNKSPLFFSASHLSHSFFFFSSLPSASLLTLQSKSCAPRRLLYSCGLLFGFTFPPPPFSSPLHLPRPPHIPLPPSVAAAASPHPSVCIFGFRRLRWGDAGRRDGDKDGVGSDGEMALVERRGRTFFRFKAPLTLLSCLLLL